MIKASVQKKGDSEAGPYDRFGWLNILVANYAVLNLLAQIFWLLVAWLTHGSKWQCMVEIYYVIHVILTTNPDKLISLALYYPGQLRIRNKTCSNGFFLQHSYSDKWLMANASQSPSGERQSYINHFNETAQICFGAQNIDSWLNGFLSQLEFGIVFACLADYCCSFRVYK